MTIPANSSADMFLPENYSLKGMKLSTGEKLPRLDKGAEGSYYLKAGSYEFDLKKNPE